MPANSSKPSHHDSKRDAPAVHLQSEDQPRLAQGVRLQWDSARGGYVLLYPEGVLILNETAGAIIALCSGSRSLDEIVAQLSLQYGGDVTHDVMVFLERLSSRRLLMLETAL